MSHFNSNTTLTPRQKGLIVKKLFKKKMKLFLDPSSFLEAD